MRRYRSMTIKSHSTAPLTDWPVTKGGVTEVVGSVLDLDLFSSNMKELRWSWQDSAALSAEESVYVTKTTPQSARRCSRTPCYGSSGRFLPKVHLGALLHHSHQRVSCVLRVTCERFAHRSHKNPQGSHGPLRSYP